MFFSKKEAPKQDKLEDLKKQLLELKAKEAELDKKSVANVQNQAVVQSSVQVQPQQIVNSQPQMQVQQPVQQVSQPQTQIPQQMQYSQQPQNNDNFQQLQQQYNQNPQQYFQPQIQQPQQPFLVAGISHPQKAEQAYSDDNFGIVLHRKNQFERQDDPAPMVIRDREIEKYVGNVNGVVLEIGSSMSINVPIKPRMTIDEFIKIAERVKALSALNFETKY